MAFFMNHKDTKNTKLSFVFFLSVLSAFVVIAFTGCGPKQAGPVFPAFDGNKAYAEVEALVEFSPRDAGTPEGWRAADHIADRLRSFGFEPEVVNFRDMTPAGEKSMRNVLGMLPGKSGRWVIFGSHFDTMPGIPDFQGANDSGSSTGVLLELARMVKACGVQPEVGIIFAFFDGEEGIADYIPGDGLHGSRRMALQLLDNNDHHKFNAMFLLDMVGDKDLHFTIPVNSSKSAVKEVLNAAYATGHRDRFSLGRTMIIDDHVPFLEIGIPSIDIIDFKFGSEPGKNDHWHTSKDHLENISPESLEITGAVALQIIRQVAYEL
jgi:Zn-dependent M28 family amino/carboxypeptidase